MSANRKGYQVVGYQQLMFRVARGQKFIVDCVGETGNGRLRAYVSGTKQRQIAGNTNHLTFNYQAPTDGMETVYITGESGNGLPWRSRGSTLTEVK
jgi:hypothetical protein